MQTHVHALTALIDDLFELSRAQAGELAFASRPVEIGELVSEAVDAMRAVGEHRGVMLQAEPITGHAPGARLAAHAPGLPLTGLAAGFHAVAHVDHANEGELIGAALARSVGLYGMSQWRADHADTPTRLVLGFGNTTDRAITEGIAAIADLLRP